MKNKANLIALAAFVASLGGFHAYAEALRDEVGGGRPQSALALTRDVQPGELLSAQNLTSVDIPADYLDERRILRLDREHVLGVAVQTAIRAGEGLMWSDLADGEAHRHLAALITPGRRAYSLKPGANPLGALLRVGDHVDVLLETAGKTSTLLQRVLILAVGTQLELDQTGSAQSDQGVTLSVTSAEAEKILSAEARGELRLVARNPEDLRLDAPPLASRTKTATSSRTATTIERKEIEHVR